MKKINIKVSKLKKKHELKKKHVLKISDIKKNSSSNISHAIKLIRSRENKVVASLTAVILVVLCVSGYFVFSSIQNSKVGKTKLGPLLVEFMEKEVGMSDIVSFTEANKTASVEGFSTVNKSFVVTNNMDDSSEYAVYLDDYIDFIEFDGCGDKPFDKDDIYFSLDNSEPVRLSDVYIDGKYVLTEGVLSSNDEVSHELRVWHVSNGAAHYHGKVVVQYLQ